MQEERSARRKSGLSVSTEDLCDCSDSGCAVVDWPHLSYSEISSKCSRRDEETSHCKKQSLSDKCTSNPFDLRSNCDLQSVSASILLKSINFCSPILKEDRGYESWRDFL